MDEVELLTITMMCGGLAGFQNGYFKGKGNLEARVTRLEWMAAGMLGLWGASQ
ncbi:hypothetical protein [Microcoleus sp. MON2_D5]|uniref:hypothetical protein n=1 Tax=Microcoleus sp. MON2_D5 TaxID=2818833 RepID=UPI002FD05C09